MFSGCKGNIFAGIYGKRLTFAPIINQNTYMKRIILTICMIALSAFAANAQKTQEEIDAAMTNAELVAKDAFVEFPYSKVMFATKGELLSQKFKYDSYYNQMKLNHVNGLIAVLNVFSDAYVPATNDYHITVQYGANDMISSVQVKFYDKSIYEHILLFASDRDCKVDEVPNGKGKTYSFIYGGYTFYLEYTKETQTVSSSNTSTNKTGDRAHTTTTTRDVSYDQFVYTIYTGYEAQSEYLSKQAARKEKRAAKGRKAQSAGDFL